MAISDAQSTIQVDASATAAIAMPLRPSPDGRACPPQEGTIVRKKRSRRRASPPVVVCCCVTLIGILASACWRDVLRQQPQPHPPLFALSKPWIPDGRSHRIRPRSSLLPQQPAGRRRSQASPIPPSMRAALRPVARLRGGEGPDSSRDGPPLGDDLQDSELDDYIEFLLAYADDRATEDDNPLFREYRGEHTRREGVDRVTEWSLSAEADLKDGDENLEGIALASRVITTANEMEYETDQEQDFLVEESRDLGRTSFQHPQEIVSTIPEGDGETVADQDSQLTSQSELDEALLPEGAGETVADQDSQLTAQSELDESLLPEGAGERVADRDSQLTAQNELDESLLPEGAGETVADQDSQLTAQSELDEDLLPDVANTPANEVPEDEAAGIEELVDTDLEHLVVDDVDDEEQLDAMIETLVATVDDGNDDAIEMASDSDFMVVDEQFDETDIDVSSQASVGSVAADEIAVPHDVNLATEEPEEEGDEFYLGSSAVDTMTFPVPVEDDSFIPSEDASYTAKTIASSSVGGTQGTLWSAFIRTIRGKHDETAASVVESTAVDASQVVDYSEIDATEDDSQDDVADEARTPIDDDGFLSETAAAKSWWNRITRKASDSVEGRHEQPEEVQESEMDILHPLDSEILEAAQPRYVLSLQPETGETEFSTEKPDATMRKPEDEELNKSPSRSLKEFSLDVVAQVLDQNNKAFKYVTGLLGTQRSPARPEVGSTPSMDGSREEANLKAHSKIYEKYFATPSTEVSESPHSTEDLQSGKGVLTPGHDLRGRHSDIFKRPWGTLMNYINPERTIDVDDDAKVRHLLNPDNGYTAFAVETSSNQVDVESTNEVTDDEHQDKWKDAEIALDQVDRVVEKSDYEEPEDELVDQEDARRPEEAIGGFHVEDGSDDLDLVKTEEPLDVADESLGHHRIHSEEMGAQSRESLESLDSTDGREGSGNNIIPDEMDQVMVEATDTEEEEEAESPVGDALETEYVESSDEAESEVDETDMMPTEIDLVVPPDLDVESSEDWESAMELENGCDQQAENQPSTPGEKDSLNDTSENPEFSVSGLSEVVEEIELAAIDETSDAKSTAANSTTISIVVDDSDDGLGYSLTLNNDVIEPQQQDSDDEDQKIDKQDLFVQSTTTSQAFQVADYFPKQDQEDVSNGNDDVVTEMDDQDTFRENVHDSILECLEEEIDSISPNIEVGLEATHEEEDDDSDEAEEETISEPVEILLPSDSEDALDYVVEEIERQLGDLLALYESPNRIVEFFVTRGLEQWVMIAIVLFEWFRTYILAPVAESLTRILDGRSQRIIYSGRALPKWMNTRGGASLSSEDDSERTGPLEGENDRPEAEDEDSNSSGGESQGGSFVAAKSDDREQPVPRNSDGNVPTQKARPNWVYRYLLGYGIVGHILIMESILAVEWLHVYTPFIPTLVGYLMYDILKIQKESSRGSGEPLVSRASGFLKADGSVARGGRKRKAQTRKDDQKALDQLRRLGDVNQARYYFLSQSFMQRHGLGAYGRKRSENEGRDFEVDEDGLVVMHTSTSSAAEELDVESDAEWIVDALTQDEKEDDFGSPLDAKVGLSFGNGGPKINVGIGFSLGEPRKKRPRSLSSASASISDVARQRTGTTSMKRKSSGPRVSDRDSGVMGRLRAAGASSLMGRNILGAYPGDLPPPHEAADVRGLTKLAERYGYGDWSEDGDLLNDMDQVDEGFVDDGVTPHHLESDDGNEPVASKRRTRKKRVVPKTQRRKRKSKSSQPLLAPDLNVSPRQSGLSRTKSTAIAAKATTSLTEKPGLAQELEAMKPARGRTTRPTSDTSSSKAADKPSGSTLGGDLSGRRNKKNNVRPAMSLLNESKKSNKTTAKQMLEEYKEKKKRIHPAMSLLKERKDGGGDSIVRNTKGGDE